MDRLIESLQKINAQVGMSNIFEMSHTNKTDKEMKKLMNLLTKCVTSDLDPNIFTPITTQLQIVFTELQNCILNPDFR